MSSQDVSDYLEYVNQPYTPGMVMQSANGSVESCSLLHATANYTQKAAAAASSGTAPVSVFEGMQTIINLSRVRSGFNPLDPQGTGDKAHFIQFTQNIADAPMLTLLKTDTKNVQQASHDSGKIIDSFVSLFTGVASEDSAGVKAAVKSMVSNALSYANKTSRGSNFVQLLLSTNDAGVQFGVFSSQFSIHTTESKGTITYQASYSLERGLFQLSTAGWTRSRIYSTSSRRPPCPL